MWGLAYVEVHSSVRVRCEPGILDPYLVGAHGKIGCAEKALVICINCARLVGFDLPQSDLDARNSRSRSITDRSLQSPARLRGLASGRGYTYQSEHHDKADFNERATH